jgi:hypothetical protein
VNEPLDVLKIINGRNPESGVATEFPLHDGTMPLDGKYEPLRSRLGTIKRSDRTETRPERFNGMALTKVADRLGKLPAGKGGAFEDRPYLFPGGAGQGTRVHNPPLNAARMLARKRANCQQTASSSRRRRKTRTGRMVRAALPPRTGDKMCQDRFDNSLTRDYIGRWCFERRGKRGLSERYVIFLRR